MIRVLAALVLVYLVGIIARQLGRRPFVRYHLLGRHSPGFVCRWCDMEALT